MSAPCSDPVGRCCDQSERSRSRCLVRSVAATQFGRNDVSLDEVRRGKMSNTNVPSDMPLVVYAGNVRRNIRMYDISSRVFLAAAAAVQWPSFAPPPPPPPVQGGQLYGMICSGNKRWRAGWCVGGINRGNKWPDWSSANWCRLLSSAQAGIIRDELFDKLVRALLPASVSYVDRDLASAAVWRLEFPFPFPFHCWLPA